MSKNKNIEYANELLTLSAGIVNFQGHRIERRQLKVYLCYKASTKIIFEKMV